MPSREDGLRIVRGSRRRQPDSARTHFGAGTATGDLVRAASTSYPTRPGRRSADPHRRITDVAVDAGAHARTFDASSG
jgi:hypothetical protein